MKTLLILFAFVCASVTGELKAEEYRLPNNLAPIAYFVELEPNFVTDTFVGSIEIDISVFSATDSIILHARELEISIEDIEVVLLNGDVVVPESIEFTNDDRHFFIIRLPVTLEEGTVVQLFVKHFDGILNRDDEGFYLARYVAEDGEIRKLATTQFQPTAARRAFPCFDEPALKAFFQINLIRSEDYLSIANSELEETTQLSENRFLDKHKITHNVMSTYLVAFVVCDFYYVADGNHKVYGRPQYITEGRGEYALSRSRPLMDGIAAFVDIPYSWPKSDQIGIPDEYFWAGAMENWGLVTYRESLILYADGITTTQGKQNIILIMGHEYGHKWFGNLVSPHWWEYIWLNEGFASYFDYFGPAIETVEPEMEMWSQFPVRHTQTGLRQDSAANTTPMRRAVNTPSEILSMFNFVIYSKAGAVIKMMEDFMTTIIFRYAINAYLNKLSYGTAVPQDLYDSLQMAIDVSDINYLPPGHNITSILSVWELNPGYPLVTVIRDYDSGIVTLRQRRFIDSNPNNEDPTLWSIPISYSTSSRLNFEAKTPETWLLEREELRIFGFLGTSDWLVINNQQTGYYRVNYDATNWYLIINYLNNNAFGNVHRNNRAQLVDDVFALARFGVLNYDIALDLSLYLSRETDFIPLLPYFNAISFLDIYMQNSEAVNNFRSYVYKALSGAYTAFGLDEYESDSHLSKLTRQQTVSWICRHGELSCRFHALSELRTWRDEGIQIPPNLQTVYACSALRVGNQDDFDFVYNKYLNEEYIIRERMIAALGCVENEDILRSYLEIILQEDSPILETNRLGALAGIHGAGSIGLEFFYAYFKENYGIFRERFTDAQFMSIVNSLASRFTTEAQLQDFTEFANLSDSLELFTSALNTITSNVEWNEVNVPVIAAWLETHAK